MGETPDRERSERLIRELCHTTPAHILAFALRSVPDDALAEVLNENARQRYHELLALETAQIAERSGELWKKFDLWGQAPEETW
jgi:hypothetical protein